MGTTLPSTSRRERVQSNRSRQNSENIPLKELNTDLPCYKQCRFSLEKIELPEPYDVYRTWNQMSDSRNWDAKRKSLSNPDTSSIAEYSAPLPFNFEASTLRLRTHSFGNKKGPATHGIDMPDST